MLKCFQGQNTTTETADSITLPPAESLIIETTTQEGEEEGKSETYIDMEIINIEVLPRVGNAVVLSWGKPLREYHLDWTYGVYYGESMEEALRGKLLTAKL